jgi:hypothetical protein
VSRSDAAVVARENEHEAAAGILTCSNLGGGAGVNDSLRERLTSNDVIRRETLNMKLAD